MSACYAWPVLFALSAPTGQERHPLYMQQVFDIWHHANRKRLPIQLLISQHAEQAGLLCRCPGQLGNIVYGQIADAYPDCTLSQIAGDALNAPAGSALWTASVRLVPDLFPIRLHPQFEETVAREYADPLAGLLAAVSPRGDGLHSQIAMSFRPARRRVARSARRALDRLATPLMRRHAWLATVFIHLARSRLFPLRTVAWLLGHAVGLADHREQKDLTTTPSRMRDRESDLQAASDKLGGQLFEAIITVSVSGADLTRSAACVRLREIAAALGPFALPRRGRFVMGRVRKYNRRPRRSAHPSLLSSAEIASLWHPATASVRTRGMHVTQSREMEPPANLPHREREPELAVLGRVRFRDEVAVTGLRPEDRRRHVSLIGRTGCGKTTLMESLFLSDVESGRGACLLDPHGDIAESVLSAIPSHRTNDVVYLAAGDTHAVAFNPLSCPNPELRPLVASGVLGSFKKLYREFWGPRTEHILRNCLLTLLEFPDSTLLSLLQLLGDEHYRAERIPKVSDPIVRRFWQQEFGAWNDKFRSEAISPVQNKVSQFLSHPLLRAVVGQPKGTLHPRRLMDRSQLLICNLAQGRWGQDAATLLGSLLVSSLHIAAMSRSELPEEDRVPFSLFIDEFQCFMDAGESLSEILSQARKFGLILHTANQYLDQMDEATAAAIFGNIGTLVVFNVGSDAEVLSEHLGGSVTAEDLRSLPKYRAVVRMLIDGEPSRPFTIETLPPDRTRSPERREIIRRMSRHRYARSIEQVNQSIEKTLAAA